MNKNFFFLAFAFALAGAYPALSADMRVSVGGGWAFTLDKFSNAGQPSLISSSRGGPAFNAEFSMSSGVADLQVGLRIAYNKFSHAEFRADTFNPTLYPAFTSDAYNIPILLVGRYSFFYDLYAELMAGITLEGAHTTNTTYSSAPVVYLAFGAGLGYDFKLTDAFSLEPRLTFYFYEPYGLANMLEQLSPTLNIAYRF